jgi:prepilin-type N-terminal cleavage/methylation domain-containing protein
LCAVSAKDRRPLRLVSSFTLIEMMAVILIMAILSTVAALSLGSFLDRAAAQDVRGRIAFADQMLRQACAQSGRKGMLLLSSEAPLQWTVRDEDGSDQAASDDAENSSQRHAIALPRGCTIERIRVGAEVDTDESAQVVCHDGVTPTYAVQVAQAAQPPRWFIVTSIGQVQERDEKQVQAIFDRLAGKQPSLSQAP